MEDNRKEENQERVKIYDKDMYVSQEKLKTTILMILVFLIGFVAGYFSRGIIAENTQNTNNINTNVQIQE